MKEKVLLVGGAKSQCHAIDILKEMDYHVIVVDYNRECTGANLADEFFCISTTDVDSITKLACEKRVKAVLAVQSDLGIITANKVSVRLGQKALPLEMIELFTNKYRMREYLKKNNFLYPHFKKCKNEEEIRHFAEKNGFPFVMKPLDSQGSRGVEIISSVAEFEKINTTLAYSKNEAAVIVEEYLGMEEFTVEGIVVDGKHHTLAISKKRHYQDLECVSCELYYSWEEEYKELIVKHDELIDSTQVPFGITHSEYIRNEKGFVLVEFTIRGGGSMISSHIVPAVSGWDVEKIYVNQVLEKEITLPERKQNCAVLKFIQLEIGKISRIKGVDEILKIKNVLHFDLLYNEGQYVQAVENDTNRHGYFIAWAENKTALNDIIKKVEETLKVEYERED